MRTTRQKYYKQAIETFPLNGSPCTKKRWSPRQLPPLTSNKAQGWMLDVWSDSTNTTETPLCIIDALLCCSRSQHFLTSNLAPCQQRNDGRIEGERLFYFGTGYYVSRIPGPPLAAPVASILRLLSATTRPAQQFVDLGVKHRGNSSAWQDRKKKWRL